MKALMDVSIDFYLILFFVIDMTKSDKSFITGNSTRDNSTAELENTYSNHTMEEAIAQIRNKNCQVLKDSSSNTLNVLKCEGIKDLQTILEQMTNSIKTLKVSNSSFLNGTLNLSSFIRFRNLETISITKCNVSEIFGRLPVDVKTLNLSLNLLKFIPCSVFMTDEFESQEIPISRSANSSSCYSSGSNSTTFMPKPQNKNSGNDTRRKSEIDSTENKIFKVELIDLSFNNIYELPQSLFSLPKLKSLLLAGNHFKGKFVWDNLWEWANETTLTDADDAFCEFTEPRSSFSLLGAIIAKKDLEDTCEKVDKTQCPTCALHGLQKDLKEGYPISYKGKHGSISITLRLDCSNKGLTRLPLIPEQTWRLNVSNNLIKDLNPLKNPIYSNLVHLDLENNAIEIETLVGAPLLEKYITLNLRNNHISTIPMQVLNSMKSVQDLEDRRSGNTFLGGNYLKCDCNTEKEIKPFLQRYSSKFQDIDEIFCSDFYLPDGIGNLALKNLHPDDVCPVTRISDTDQEVWIYIVISIEAALILLITAKLMYDQRKFRKTGVLPWCSKKMPRLPCDTILEGFKEPGNWASNNKSNGNGKKSSTSSTIRCIFKTSRSGSDSSHSTQLSSGSLPHSAKSDKKVLVTHGTGKSQGSWV